ncbi:MAG: DUF4097 family beta strand repeat protein [Clostridia bacterium]|nr:DUF4097 family beta strand repeat protein [Clostridia bacterium]
MKNNQIMKILLALCAVVLAAVTLFPAALAERYASGGAEIGAAVRNLDINWTSGQVNIAYHNGDTVILSEKTTGVISKDMQMRWCLDGDTLRVEYEQPGFHLFSLLPHEKELTVTLPMGRSLDQVSIQTASGDLNIPALQAGSVTLKTASGSIRASVNAGSVKASLVSGDVQLEVLNEAEEISLKTVSGRITLDSAGTSGKTALETTSGGIRATVKAAKEFKAKSTSGDIHAVVGVAGKAEIGSVSGKATVEMSAMQELDVHTTSGDVTACLPTAPGFTARIETTSGNIKHNLPLTQNGKDYTAGDGSAAVKIHTTSGNVTVNAKEN